MTPDLLFTVCTYGAMPAWLLLLFAPRWSGTQKVVHAIWIPLLLGPVYTWLLFAGDPPPEGAGFGTLSGVMAFFTVPTAALAGWVHYIVFDLFVGAWEVRDAERKGIPHLWVAPCLFFTLMAGPLGLLLYLGLRFLRTRSTELAEVAA